MPNTRTASDVLISIEQDVKKMLNLIGSQDLKISILSNKLNEAILKLNEVKSSPSPSPIFANTTDSNQEVIKHSKIVEPEVMTIDVSNNIDIDASPNGHRRTSRHQTYTRKNSFKNESEQATVQVPTGHGTQIISPEQIVLAEPDFPQVVAKPQMPEPNYPEEEFPTDNVPNIDPNALVPVVQRIVYPNSKAVFMAEVSILSLPDLDVITTKRTTGTGKWSASLQPGSYRVSIRKRDPETANFITMTTDIVIDGKTSPQELQAVVFSKQL